MVCVENKSWQTWLVALLAMALGACSGESGGDSISSDAGASHAGAAPEAEVAPHPGEKIYGEYCFSCHSPGLNGAPKLGDAEAWAPRVAKGADLLLAATIEGIPPAMPPRGICMSCSDEELAAAIDYMIVNSE